jgi:enamine deaminase RidA (YjgF/YER057c/UK114 family)
MFQATCTEVCLGEEKRVNYIDADESSGRSAAVVVPPGPLVFTGQFFGAAVTGGARSDARSIETQVDSILRQINEALSKAETDASSIARLNVYVTGSETATEVKALLGRSFAGRSKPAMTFVETRLPVENSQVAMDAIAVAGTSRASHVRRFANTQAPRSGRSVAAVLPAGPVVFVSGQAEAGKDMAEATRRTMESLGATLAHLGLEQDDIVQVKAFLGPMTMQAEALAAIERYFEERNVPPVSIVEWTMAAPIEIELVAAAGRKPAAGDERIEFLPLPGMTTSPVFSRVTRVNAGRLVFVSGLYGTSRRSGAAEVNEVFVRLAEVLAAAGSDLNHLAKATYYVSTDDASVKLNELRPRFYDPKRPPAASKAPVSGTGVDGATINVDMIAVTSK